MKNTLNSKKYIVLIFSIIFSLTSCDSPRSKRTIGSTNSLSGSMDWSNPGTNPSNPDAPPPSPPTTTTPTPASNIPTDATHCQFASDGVTGFKSTSTHLGEYTLCQSSTDKNIVYFQLKTPPKNNNNDISICFIPTTSVGTNSIYVGNPMCGYFNDPKSVRKITFIKYSQYSNANINGAIFFKDQSWWYYNSYMMTLDAYITCMNMLAAGNSAYCTQFKNVNQYVYQQF